MAGLTAMIGLCAWLLSTCWEIGRAISAPPAVSEYSSQMVGFDLINGVYSTSGTGGTAVLTISAKAQKAALEALDGRKGVVGGIQLQDRRDSLRRFLSHL